MTAKQKKLGVRNRRKGVQLSFMINPALVPVIDAEAYAAGIDRADILRQLTESYALRKVRDNPGKFPQAEELLRVREDTSRAAAEKSL